MDETRNEKRVAILASGTVAESHRHCDSRVQAVAPRRHCAAKRAASRKGVVGARRRQAILLLNLKVVTVVGSVIKGEPVETVRHEMQVGTAVEIVDPIVVAAARDGHGGRRHDRLIQAHARRLRRRRRWWRRRGRGRCNGEGARRRTGTRDSEAQTRRRF